MQDELTSCIFLCRNVILTCCDTPAWCKCCFFQKTCIVVTRFMSLEELNTFALNIQTTRKEANFCLRIVRRHKTFGNEWRINICSDRRWAKTVTLTFTYQGGVLIYLNVCNREGDSTLLILRFQLLVWGVTSLLDLILEKLLLLLLLLLLCLTAHTWPTTLDATLLTTSSNVSPAFLDPYCFPIKSTI